MSPDCVDSVFRFHPLRFSFIARESIHFAEGKSANILRGAFGMVFRRIACVPQCADAAKCAWRAECPYARMFEPSAIGGGPSGLADWPRPFVFRATHLDGRTFAAGEHFYFDLNLFETKGPAVAYLVLSFAQLAREGLGPGRRRVDLTEVVQLDLLGDDRSGSEARIYESGSMLVQQNVAPAVFDLRANERVSRLRVKFLTPTELKSGQQIAGSPEFGVLVARARDRISTLRELYGEGALQIDFREFAERAARVKMISCKIREVEVRRRSSRTGQVHSLGGFIGEAEYAGEMAEFVPYLRVAKWTGVGRQTVWGKGEIEVDVVGNVV